MMNLLITFFPLGQPNPIYLPLLTYLPNLTLTIPTPHSPLTPLIYPIPLERFQLLPNTNYCHREQILLSSNWQTTRIYFDKNGISNLKISFNLDDEIYTA